MAKANNKNNKPGKANAKGNAAAGKQRTEVKAIDKAKFRVKKGSLKDKRSRSVNFARSNYQKKKLQNQQFESIKSLNAKSDQIQGAIRSSTVETDFERLKAPEYRPVDINQAINAINSL